MKTMPTLDKSSETCLKSILEEFSKNRFDPRLNSKIPNSSGNYILCLREKSTLPWGMENIIFTKFQGLNVLYTGSSMSLNKRCYTGHFIKNSGQSTLRKSLGVLFGYKLVPRDKNGNRKTKFEEENEDKISEWMKQNLIVYYLSEEKYKEMEHALINYFNPPLNIQSNSNEINSTFREELASLRKYKNEY